MAIKVPIVTEFNKSGLSDADRALRSFGVKSTTELKKAAAGFGILGAAGMAAFSELDKGYDAIVAGTGATGAALRGLKDDADAVARTVPNSFDQVGIAVAEVNTRLGLTGPILQDRSKQFLDLARVAKVDVQTAIKDTARTFNDWGVESKDQSAVLDQLFAATQASGVGIDKLNTSVVQFGAPLRQMGFSLEESIALFSKFEAEGVNTEAVMSGMRQGLGKLSKAGEEPAEAFRRIVAEIENVGTTGEANALAIETFGQRAGPDMAAAIREGRFELDDFVAMLGDTEGALETAAEKTLSANDRFAMLGNQLLTASGPAVEMFAEITERLVGALTLLPKPVQGAVVMLGTLAIASKSAGSAMAAFGVKTKTAAASSGALTAGLAVAGVAMVGYGLHAKQMADANADLVASIDDLGRATDEEMARGLIDTLIAGAFAGKGFDETLADIARTSPGTLQRIVDLEEGTGVLSAQLLAGGESTEKVTEVLGYLNTALDDEKVALEAAAESQARTNDITNEATESLEENTDEVDANAEARSDAAAEAAADAARLAPYKDRLDEITAGLEAQRAEIHQWAEQTNASAASAAQSFGDFADEGSKTIAGFSSDLTQSTWDITGWQNDLIAIASETSPDFAKYLMDMGESGAGLVKELAKGDPQETFDQWVNYSEAMNRDMAAEFDKVGPGATEALAEVEAAATTAMAETHLAMMAETESFNTIGIALADGVAAGITQGAPNVSAAASRVIEDAYNAAKISGNIRSPSRLFAEGVGQPISQGIAKGIDEDAYKIDQSLAKAIEDASEAAVDNARDLVDAVNDELDGVWESISDTRDRADLDENVEDAAQRVADDLEAIADARQRGEEDIADAMESAAEVRVASAASIEAAEHGVLKANRDVTLAEIELSKLRINNAQDTEKIEAAEWKVEEARRASAAAVQKLADANETGAERIADADAKIAEAKEDAVERLEAAEERHAESLERLRDANLKLAEATSDALAGDEATRAAWVKTAEAAGLTANEIAALIAQYEALAEAQANAADVEAQTAAEAVAAEATRLRFADLVNNGLVGDELLAQIAAASGDPQTQLNMMAKKIKDLEAFFASVAAPSGAPPAARSSVAQQPQAFTSNNAGGATLVMQIMDGNTVRREVRAEIDERDVAALAEFGAELR